MEVIGIVKDGRIVVPSSVHLPEGAEVRVLWETGESAAVRPPLERRPLTRAAIDADIAWANGERFGP